MQLCGNTLDTAQNDSWRLHVTEIPSVPNAFTTDGISVTMPIYSFPASEKWKQKLTLQLCDGEKASSALVSELGHGHCSSIVNENGEPILPSAPFMDSLSSWRQHGKASHEVESMPNFLHQAYGSTSLLTPGPRNHDLRESSTDPFSWNSHILETSYSPIDAANALDAPKRKYEPNAQENSRLFRGYVHDDKPRCNAAATLIIDGYGAADHPAAGSHGRRICLHGRVKSQCKDCGGPSFCIHGRRKTACKDCGGSLFCSHGRQKSRCKDCGGVSICCHGRRRSQCKDCGGADMCGHGRRKSACKVCRGEVGLRARPAEVAVQGLRAGGWLRAKPAP